MRGFLRKRGQWSVAVSVLCVLLVLVMGMAQAVHTHAGDAARHDCSICSTPNAKLNTAHVSVAPVMSATPLVSVEISAPRIFRPATANFVRPPPSA